MNIPASSMRWSHRSTTRGPSLRPVIVAIRDTVAHICSGQTYGLAQESSICLTIAETKGGNSLATSLPTSISKRPSS